MADVVVGCLVIFLLLNACLAGLPGLAEGTGSSPTDRADNHIINESSMINKMMVHPPRYKCHQCEPPNCTEESSGVTCHSALYCFKSSVRGPDGSMQFSRGCTAHPDHYRFTCWTGTPGMRKRHASQLNVSCCQGDMCNDGDFPDLAPQPDTAIEPLPANPWRLWASVAASVLALSVVAAMAVFVLRRSHRLRVSRCAQKLGADSYYPPCSPPLHSAHTDGAEGSSALGGLLAVAAGDSTLREYLDASLTSGSGAGLPLMVQRTLARQLHLIHCVGKGRFGEVWRGLWYADSVAVKIFFSRDEASWRRETEIYSTVLLRHENILAYIGSDMISRNSCTQLWLITHYHPLGSLYEHLARATLTRQQMMAMAISIVNGVLHLHTEIHGTQGKPAIAHRDIKSKNILVKSDGSCCVADFGLAATRAHVAAAAAAAAEQPRRGTKRYMSPELLDHSMNLQCFESYRKCDIYALALVLWELRSRTGAAPPEYRAPYSELVGCDPSFDDMKKIVCDDGARPLNPASTQPTMVGLDKLMQECWHANPSVRLPALRIKKTLLKLAQHDNAINLDLDNEVSL